MIALFLALAPVAYFGNPGPCLDAKTPTPVRCSIPAPSEETFRVRVMSEHLECGPISTDKACHDLAAHWFDHCFGVVQCTDEPGESYCIWRSDGTVEAKNAVCSDRKGERQ